MAESTARQAEQSDPEALKHATMAKIEAGELVEDIDEMFADYRKALVQTLTIAAQSEVTVLTWAYTAYPTCPDIGAKVAVSATIQDEVGHAHQQGMLLERFGVSMREKTFDIAPETIKTLMIMQFELKNYFEFLVSQCFLDRAGRITTRDIELNCSFAPYRRSLRKINFEEKFHVGHGEQWVKFYAEYSPETRAAVQKALDWMFPHGVTWFGLPDWKKTRTGQLDYKVRGWSNDTMREMWLQSACKFADDVGLDVPAHFDDEQGKYVLDCPFPMMCDVEKREWIWEQADWDDTINQLKHDGPMNPSAHARLQTEVWGERLWKD